MTFHEQENKRAKPRHNLYLYLKVVDIETLEPIGRVVDMTTDGMLLVNDGAFKVGSLHNAKIILTGDLFDLTMGDIEISFTIQWSKPDINPSLFVNGAKFTNLTPQASRTIEKVIRKFSFEEEN